MLSRPLLIEGAAGVGKTEMAAAMARVLDTRLIRLQCYEGLDATHAIYEWNYQRQLLAIKSSELDHLSASEVEEKIFSEQYLIPRPLLQSIREKVPPVLLIDEIDRSDTEFEAFLLELLADFQITIPELGTIRATARPHIVLTSNGTREISDALRRRCLYTYMDYPDTAREEQIIAARLPQIDAALAAQLARFVGGLRKLDLEKTPGIAETLDWAAALLGMNVASLGAGPERLRQTMICLLKTEADLRTVSDETISKLAGQAV